MAISKNIADLRVFILGDKKNVDSLKSIVESTGIANVDCESDEKLALSLLSNIAYDVVVLYNRKDSELIGPRVVDWFMHAQKKTTFVVLADSETEKRAWTKLNLERCASNYVFCLKQDFCAETLKDAFEKAQERRYSVHKY